MRVRPLAGWQFPSGFAAGFGAGQSLRRSVRLLDALPRFVTLDAGVAAPRFVGLVAADVVGVPELVLAAFALAVRVPLELVVLLKQRLRQQCEPVQPLVALVVRHVAPVRFRKHLIAAETLEWRYQSVFGEQGWRAARFLASVVAG